MSQFCANCGLCCMHMSSPPFMPDEFQALPHIVRDDLERFLDSPRATMEHDDKPCVWLNVMTGSCKHYDHRPGVCRDFEVGSASCRTQRMSVGLTIEGMPTPLEDE